MPIGTYTPPLAKALHNFFFQIFFFFFLNFRCILLQISHQKCFFINISIPGRSGVKVVFVNYKKTRRIEVNMQLLTVFQNSFQLACTF